MATTAPATTRIRNFIGGEERDGAEHGDEPVLNPATEQEIARAPMSGDEDVDAAVRAAAGAFEGWAGTPPGERALARRGRRPRLEGIGCRAHGGVHVLLTRQWRARDLLLSRRVEDRLVAVLSVVALLAADEVANPGACCGGCHGARPPLGQAAWGVWGPSASSTGMNGIPTPCATAGWVTCPAATFTPVRSPGSREIASRTPWSASANT